MRNFLFSILAFAFFSSTHALAMPVQRLFQDIKLPTQAVMEHYNWAGPALASATAVKSGAALANGSATTISTFTAQPDFPRNIVLTTGGTTANIGAGTAVVSGTNIFGQAISENFTISSTQNGATTGNKAFKTVSSVLFPATTGGGATVSVGYGSKLGVIRCANDAGDYVFSKFNAAFETSRGTFATDATHIESNTFIPNGTMDGSKVVELFYVQNFRCFP